MATCLTHIHLSCSQESLSDVWENPKWQVEKRADFTAVLQSQPVILQPISDSVSKENDFPTPVVINNILQLMTLNYGMSYQCMKDVTWLMCNQHMLCFLEGGHSVRPQPTSCSAVDKHRKFLLLKVLNINYRVVQRI